ncbi:hypothetical protein SAMN06265338_1388 [Rhodoblastus acidophilus]|uniref:Uncharacterized protein n=1 Tax=Rhodoblastus acidophilus TaxID=1074 RepID=A0A212SGK7_RHOAC|nr:hypothetical protein [Rhodoblastus acidophilus]SNB84691.1 hypothetical protein SAMN06265338_1388 [Rhodoblastus acidophilus]
MTEGLNVAYVAEVVRLLLLDSGRDVVLEDRDGGEPIVIPADMAAAPDGLLPVFLSSGEAIALDAFGETFGLKLERDIGAFFSWRVEAIAAETFSEVLLATMEAIAQATTDRGIMVLEFPRVTVSPRSARSWWRPCAA